MSENPAVTRLRSLLRDKGRAWSAPIEHHDKLESTNRRMRDWALLGAPNGAVVMADEQTSGRGRRGRRWISPRGNIYLSLLVRPGAASNKPHLLSLAAAIGVVDALATYGVAAELKWPNDVLVRQRKIAGILAEGLIRGGKIESVVVGVGVNVNLVPRGVPAERGGPATSMRFETGVDHDYLEVASTVLIRIAECYDALAHGGARQTLEEWRRRSVVWWGRTAVVYVGGHRIKGVIEDLDENGALILRKPDGSRETLLDGEICELRLDGTVT